MLGFSRIGRDVIICLGSREKYKANLDPEIYSRLFTSCPQRGGVGNIASVKPLGLHSLGKTLIPVLGCKAE